MLSDDHLSKKLLPMRQPVLNTYNIYASLLSLIGPQENAWSWVMNHFIQVVHMGHYGTYFFDTHRMLLQQCPWVHSYCVPKHMIRDKWRSLKDFIVEEIQNNRYIWLSIDQSFLPISYYYQKESYVHELFIFGYDLSQNSVHIADHFLNGKYVLTQCNFDDLELAFWSHSLDNQFVNQVYLFSKNEQMDNEFNLKQIHYLLDCYVHSKDTFQFTVSDRGTFGIQAVELLKGNLESVLEDRLIDIRPYHLLWERNSLMVRRIEYIMMHVQLPKGELLYERCKAQEKCILLLRNMLLKYILSRNPQLLERAHHVLTQYITEEKKWCPELLEAIYSSGLHHK